ncbi:LysR family transcriptional regulator [Salinivibrio kushneri]|uniref:LysR family transcriptional regulator n=1 Tax=Salinivibrio kushneri TaxID=1908198 RepID=UPI00098854A1|nr:LysR family transcriptional regulator [Salinivibrio kushneri]OOE53462.1 LysR family transcriptional regulator [Salinivibrio kushneri]
MDIKQLRHVIAIAEAKSFTLAAQRLHIAQPALSIAIKKLENQLGMPIFIRNEKHIQLTQEGQVLLQHAYRVVQQMQDAATAMDELKGLQKGEVRIGVPGMLGSYFFPELLMGFRRRYPTLKLTVVEAGTHSLRQMLLDGELDLAVINDRDVPDSLDTTHLISSQMVAVVATDHPLAKHSTLDYHTFFAHELIMFRPGYFHRDYLDQVCDTHAMTPKLSLETNLLAMILNIVRHGFAISALLDMVTEHESGIVGIPFTQPIKLDISIAWRKEGYLSLADRAFIDYVQQHNPSAQPSMTS